MTMTDASRTAICLLVDRSGSMRAIKDSAQDAINEFVQSQRERGNTTMRIVQFDAPGWEGNTDWYMVHTVSVPAEQVPEFELHPRGMTALYDAVALAVTEFGAELTVPESERPGTVIFAIMTDGQENSSKENNSVTVRKIIEEQAKRYAWNFVYLGANQDAILEGEKMGISRNSSITYTASARGTRSVVDSLDSYVASSVRGGAAAFTDQDRKRAVEKD
jgi:hypothetical protein